MSKVYLPEDMSSVLRILSDDPLARVYAGGTDLLAKNSGRAGDDGPLVCLERVEELKGVSESGDEVRIGACTTHNEVIKDRLIEHYFLLLSKAARSIGAPAVRNMGTIGGNICTASPAGDTLPPLYVFGAELELCSMQGKRRVKISDFIKGPGSTDLRQGEILLSVYLKKGHGFTFHHFEKVGQRKAMAISVASLAFAARLSAEGIIGEEARCAFGSVAPTVFTSGAVDRCFTGRPIDAGVLDEAAVLVRESVSPISDVRASREYRRTVAGNLLMRLKWIAQGKG